MLIFIYMRLRFVCVLVKGKKKGGKRVCVVFLCIIVRNGKQQRNTKRGAGQKDAVMRNLRQKLMGRGGVRKKT